MLFIFLELFTRSAVKENFCFLICISRGRSILLVFSLEIE